MPNKWDYQDGSHEVKIEADSDTLIPFQDLEEVSSLMNGLNLVIPIKVFTFKQKAVPNEHQYDYEFEALDGRTWKQVIDFSSSTNNPAMNFDIADFFLLSEFAPHRPIRNKLIALKAAFALTLYKWKAE